MADGFDWRNPDYASTYAGRSERLERLRGDSALLVGVKAHYAEHPADFIHDWGMTFDPRNAEVGLPTTVPFLLFPKQREFIEFVHRKWLAREDWLAEKSRDMGVSWLCVGFAVWMFLFKPGSVVGFGSRKEEYVDDLSDPKSLFWKIRAFIQLLPVEFRPKGYNEKKHAPFMSVVNPENGAAIVGEAGDNIGRGNRTSIYFKDESAFYERPEKIDAALSQTSNCKGDVSTPNGAGNPFYRKRKGGKVEVFTFNWRDDPRKGPEWYDKQVHDLDPVVLAQEVDINYEASVTDAFIPGELVDAAQANGPATVEGRGHKKWGLDVARFGDDKSVLTKRLGRVVSEQIPWQGIETQQLAQRVWDMAKAEHPDQIAVDVIGIGAGVYDRLVELAAAAEGTAHHWPVQIVAVNSSIRVDDGVNYNVRAKVWEGGRDWLKDGPVSLPNDPTLKAELCALKYLYRNGLRLIESKDDAKKRGIKSPDFADSLMLTFAEPVLLPGTVTLDDYAVDYA
jgi:phage terminase large subunit